jgi:hypothetical protein
MFGKEITKRRKRPLGLSENNWNYKKTEAAETENSS